MKNAVYHVGIEKISGMGPVGTIRRTRLAQMPAAFWMPQEDVFRVICLRSVAQYVFDLLSGAARPGSDVGVF